MEKVTIKSSYEYLAQPDLTTAFVERNKALKALGQRTRQKTATPGNKLGVVSTVVNIYSDDVRLTGTIWKPEAAMNAPQKSYPAILLCHGWGGIRDSLDARFALDFAKAGFVTLTFDYRGWNDSDGTLSAENCENQQELFRKLAKDDLPSASTIAFNARVVRETIDMEWQIADIISAFHFLIGESVVDPTRVGIWGISQGGGHAITIGAKLRGQVKAIVAHVPSCGNVGAGSPQNLKDIARAEAIERARGVKRLPQGVRKFHIDGMDGCPVLSKLCLYSPLSTAHLIECPALVIDVEEEEMFDKKDNGFKAYEIIKVKNPSSQYVILPGRHYDAYDGSLNQYSKATEIIVQFFKQHLGATRSSL